MLPEGYIYPRAGRAVRDLLRQRSQLVRQKVTQLLSLENLYSRHPGSRPSANQLRLLTVAAVEEQFGNTMIAQAITSSLMVMHCLEEEIEQLEQVVKAQVKLQPAFKPLLTVAGMGPIVGLTIMLETGAIQRFPKVGHFASYCRCVDSQRVSNGKRQGQGNTQNGNKYLAWAFVEAANVALRYHAPVQRFYQRKCAKTRPVVARQAVAHKLARACYYVLRDQVPFDIGRAFG